MSNFLLKNPHCVHIHIAKTGGSSIRLGIWPGRPTDPEVGPYRGYEGPIHGHIPDAWASYFKFAFVRHPIDRFFSAYRDFRDIRGYTRGIESFAAQTLDPDGSIANFGSVKHHTFPQTHPENNLDQADFVGRFENYAADLIKILDKVGMVWTNTFPQLRSTKLDINGLRPSTHAALRDYYVQDFEELGYE